MKNLSFKYRIFLGIALVVIVYATCFIAFIKLYMTGVLNKEIVLNGRAFTKIVAESISHMPEPSDLQLLRAYLKHTMDTNKEISYMFIQKDNKVIVHTFADAFPLKIPDLGQTQEGIGCRTVTLQKETYCDFAAPLDLSSGTLHVGISERLGKGIAEHVIILLAGITLVILAAALGISTIVARRLTRPLTLLSLQAAEIANKNFAGQVDIRSKDEISQLTTAFNTMLQTVREREDDLTEINNELETVNLTLHDYIEKLRTTTDELIKSKQDTAVVDTARSFLHHVRQPLTYLIMAIDLLSDDITHNSEINSSSLQRRLDTIEEASKKLSGLLKKFDNLKEYKVINFDEATKITDIGE